PAPEISDASMRCAENYQPARGDGMRRVIATVCVHVIALATIVFSGLSAEGEDYQYPYRDPYLATVTSAIVNADRFSPRLPRQVVHVPGLPGRNRLPGLEGRERLSVALYRQNHPAPLVFILCGIGTNPFFGPATFYANLFHREGSHVVILPSPMTWNFALASSRSAAPGYAPEDARDLYDAMATILSFLRARDAVNITDVNFMGTSLGALERDGAAEDRNQQLSSGDPASRSRSGSRQGRRLACVGRQIRRGKIREDRLESSRHRRRLFERSERRSDDLRERGQGFRRLH